MHKKLSHLIATNVMFPVKKIYKSLIYISNKSGASVDPCTPKSISVDLLKPMLSFVFCHLLLSSSLLNSMSRFKNLKPAI